MDLQAVFFDDGDDDDDDDDDDDEEEENGDDDLDAKFQKCLTFENLNLLSHKWQ